MILGQIPQRNQFSSSVPMFLTQSEEINLLSVVMSQLSAPALGEEDLLEANLLLT